jgi:hypothetical protein
LPLGHEDTATRQPIGRLMSYTDLEKANEAQRELGLRMVLYEKRVRAGLMTKQDAERKIDIMRDIARDYFRKAKPELDL